MKKRARLPQKIIDEYKRISKNLLRKHADWDERILRIHAAKLFVRNPYIYKGIVVDGLHRIIHALLDGKELIAAQSFKELPAEAFVTPKRRQNEAESSAGAFSCCYV